MCCFSELFVSSEFFITDKTYKCFLVMNFPCIERPLHAFSHGFLKRVYYYSRNTGPHINYCRFQYEAQDFFLFLVLRSYVSCNSWQTCYVITILCAHIDLNYWQIIVQRIIFIITWFIYVLSIKTLWFDLIWFDLTSQPLFFVEL